MKTTESKKPRAGGSPRAEGGELVFVVDVSSFTKNGFKGTTAYEGTRIDIEFDDGNEGVFLPSEMAERVGGKKGDNVSISIEDGSTAVARTRIAGVTKRPRISDQKVYYSTGREGGAIIRVRRA